MEDSYNHLSKKQKAFCQMVDRDNQEEVDVGDDEAMLLMSAKNLVKIYLTAQTEREKKRSALLILKLKRPFLPALLHAAGIDIEELKQYQK